MIPYAYVTGTFYTAAGVARANERIIFQPLSTPYAVDGEIVLSVPQSVVLDSQGRLHDGNSNLRYQLAKGFYRVIASDTDAFNIEVPDDQAEHSIASLTSEVSPSPVIGVQQLLTPNDLYNAVEDSPLITWSNTGPALEESQKIVFIGEVGVVSDEEYFYRWMNESHVWPQFILGNANPGGLESTLESNMWQWNTFMEVTNAYKAFYALGTADYAAPSEIEDVLTTLGPMASGRYYKVATGTLAAPVDVFVLDSNNDTPDGNTSNSVQGQWLQSQLALSTARWKIVCFQATPVCSVTGKANPAMNWPFKAWGADLVVAAGSLTSEYRVLEDGTRLFVVGTSGKGPYESFTATEDFVYGQNTARQALVVDITASLLSVAFVDVPTGARWVQIEIAGKTDRKITASLDVKWDSGLTASSPNGDGLRFEPWGFAKFWGEQRGRQADYALAQNYTPVISVASVPTTAMAHAEPMLKRAILMVGFDPIVLWAWNKAKGDFDAIKAHTYDGVSQYNGSRTQLATPTFTYVNSPSVLGVTVTHETAGVDIWVSLDFAPFTRMESWPALVLFNDPKANRPSVISAFAVKTGFIDSEIVSQEFAQSRPTLTVSVEY